MAETLPPFVLAQLFSGSYIIAEEKKAEHTAMPEVDKAATTAQPASSGEPAVQWFLGENRKSVTIIVSDTENIFISDVHLQFLVSILSACRLNLADIALINIAAVNMSFPDIKTELQPQQVVSFGISQSVTGLPFTIPEYQLQTHNGCAYLFAPELAGLTGNSAAAKERKTKLWQSLKKMFNV